MSERQGAGAAPCPVCGGRDCAVIEEHSPPFRVLVCRECDAGFVSPVPDEAFLAAAYDGDYYEPWKGQEKRRAALWRRRLASLPRPLPAGPVLDVGCGDGLFLRLLQREGIDAEGTEFSADAVDAVGGALGIPVHHGELFDLGLPGGRFGAVTMWHALEHVREPMRTLREAHRVLVPGGVLAVAVPNRDNRVFRLVYRVTKGRPLRLFAPEDRELHLSHFTPRSLLRAISAAGFEHVTIVPDRAAVRRDKRVVERLGLIVSALLGRPWWDAQLAIARKPSGRE